MEKRDLIYEGKAKKVYATDDPANVIVCYKDDATAFDGMKKGIICGKGAVNNRMSNYLMQKLSEKGIPTHFLKELNDRETLVRKVAIRRRRDWLCFLDPGRRARRPTRQPGLSL